MNTTLQRGNLWKVIELRRTSKGMYEYCAACRFFVILGQSIGVNVQNYTITDV